jgi:signal transduction histidine kinase
VGQVFDTMKKTRSARRPRVSHVAPSTRACAELEAVLDALPVGLHMVDRDLRVVAWNSHREAGPQGRPRAEVRGRLLSEILSAAGYRATVPVLRRVFDTGEPHEETTEPTGQARQFRILRLPVRSGRRVSHVLSWFEDITERRALEMQLIASDRLAFLGQLVAGVAHEVSNPLASIAGCAEALASLANEAASEKGRREAEQFRDLIRSEVARCERILRTLHGAARPDPTSVADMASTVDTVLRLIERHPAFTRVHVRRRIPAGLPPAAIDVDSLKQVVIALAMNAARAIAGGGTLTLLAGRRRTALVLDVVDTGPGVAEEIRKRIFEPFFTTDSTKGSGLGLAIARSLVRGHGGDLIYRPRRGRGAAFRVLLKLGRRGA